MATFRVHLVDGTYELYRQHFGQMGRADTTNPYAATVGVLQSTLRLIADGATHVAVATDHVIESFRNALWPGYKTSEGMEPELLEQIPIVEEALRAMGVTVFAMAEHEADASVSQVRLLTPDKDLGQCVSGTRVVQVDRRNDVEFDESAIRSRFGVGPSSIPDYLALVGDSSDGFPGLPGWGAKSAAAVLGHYLSLDAIPDEASRWAADGVVVRGAERLATSLRDGRATAELFRTLATLVTTVPVGTPQEWRWRGPEARFAAVAEDIGSSSLAERAARLAASPPSGG